MIDLEGGPCVAKRLSGCGSGTEYLAVTPWGDFIHVTSLSAMKVLLGNVDEGIKIQRSVMSLSAVMSMQKKNAENVSQDSTAAADVQQMRIISAVTSVGHMISDVNCRKNVLSARS